MFSITRQPEDERFPGLALPRTAGQLPVGWNQGTLPGRFSFTLTVLSVKIGSEPSDALPDSLEKIQGRQHAVGAFSRSCICHSLHARYFSKLSHVTPYPTVTLEPGHRNLPMIPAPGHRNSDDFCPNPTAPQFIPCKLRGGLISCFCLQHASWFKQTY